MSSISSISIIIFQTLVFKPFLYSTISTFLFQLVLVAYIQNQVVYSITNPFYISEYNFCSAVTSFSRSPNIYIIQFLKLSQLKKIYLISRLVVVVLLVWYSVKYGLNHFNALPIKNIPAYITISTAVGILCSLY